MGVVAHKCFPVCSIWCKTFAMRTESRVALQKGVAGRGPIAPCWSRGGGLDTKGKVSCPVRRTDAALAKRLNLRGTSSPVRTSMACKAPRWVGPKERQPVADLEPVPCGPRAGG